MATKKGIQIVEKHPGGEGSFKDILGKFDDIDQKGKDLRPIWKILTPDLKKVLKYTFSQSNPSRWARLDGKYIEWKRKHGYPDTIGIMTGALKKSLTDDAKIKAKKKKLIYKSNPSTTGTAHHVISGRTRRKVGNYARYFDGKRPIMIYAREWLDIHLNKIVAEWITRGWG